MDYYQTMRNDFVHKSMYPEDPMRVDWIPKGPIQSGTLTIRPKERCPPRFVSKIEGNAVEESARVFFEGIVDAQPQPKFSWYFEDEPIVPGRKGWEDAEIHDSRKMSTLILRYTREHHMGKYSLRAANQLGEAECSCDLIVRKKQFPPVFWQRLYNVNGGDPASRRFVGEVEVGGWPVPQVYWYRVMEDGEEVEVTTHTHTENWNGNPNKYVPERRVEVRQIDAIRHVIIFHQVSEADSGLYRVRAINALGEAECEAELRFDGAGVECSNDGGNNLYLPPLWRERKRLTWRDEDQRKKPFVGFKEPELTPEELAEMRGKCAGVPLGRIMEYLASLPDYRPSDKFRGLPRMPFKPGVDERDYRPERRGGQPSWPSTFKKGRIEHRGYNTDVAGRIRPVWRNPADPRTASGWPDLLWRPVHPDLWIPELPPRSKSPPAPPVWETEEDIRQLVALLNSMGCRNVPNATEIRPAKRNPAREMLMQQTRNTGQEMLAEEASNYSAYTQHKAVKASSKVEKFSYILPNAEAKEVETVTRSKPSSVSVELPGREEMPTAMQHQKELSHSNSHQQQQRAYQQHQQQYYFEQQQQCQQQEQQLHYQQQQENDFERRDNYQAANDYADLGGGHRPALPPKTKIMNSPSRNIFSPTGSDRGDDSSCATTTASVKTVEFLPVREKVKLIAAQQEELCRREQEADPDAKRPKGVRILPPSPVTVRKMSVEEELYYYDKVVTRTTPVTQVMEQEDNNRLTYLTSPIEGGTGVDLWDKEEKVKEEARQIQQIQKSQESSVSMLNSSSEVQTMSSAAFFSSQQQSSATSASIAVPGWGSSMKLPGELGAQRHQDQVHKQELQQQQWLDKAAQSQQINSALDRLIAETESMAGQDMMQLIEHQQQFQSYSSHAVTHTSSSVGRPANSLILAHEAVVAAPTKQDTKETPAEACRRSFEEAELEAMALASETSARSFSKQSSVVETASVQSFVLQQENQNHLHHHQTLRSAATKSSDADRSQKLVNKSSSFVRTPETFVKPQPASSLPGTPLSQRRRLRINQSPKPPGAEAPSSPHYRDAPSTPFQPGFYRVPPEDPEKAHIFQLVRRSSSRSRVAAVGSGDGSRGRVGSAASSQDSAPGTGAVHASNTSSQAYEGDNESDLEAIGQFSLNSCKN